ncbi:MAG: hypothetical protein LBS18_02245 [Clostridiales bacterium]|nr:hypothetical protein [Clostridiales bacterium]
MSLKKVEKVKNIALAAVFAGALACGLLLHPLLPDAVVSYSERRYYKQFPKMSASVVLNASWMGEFETYLLDQFPMRDGLRSVKAGALFYTLCQSDNNGVYVKDGNIFKMNGSYKEDSVMRFSEKLNTLVDTYFKKASVYVAVIPDKSQYLRPHAHLQLPYDEMTAVIQAHLHEDIAYIPLKDTLSLQSYYKTDVHWRQESLMPVVERLSAYMGFSVGKNAYQPHEYAPFYGGYYGQLGLSNITPDTLRYLSWDGIDEIEVNDIEHPGLTGVYYEKGLAGMDAYDVFLNGATPVLTLKNSRCTNGKGLLVFRDSFASSLAPLMIEGYERITLVDLRYIESSLLEEYVNLRADDVLFLYGELIPNNSDLLK